MKKRTRSRLQREFLATFATMGIEKACVHLGISRFTPYTWLHNDPGFKMRYDEQLARYECTWEAMSDEDYEEAAANMRLLPERDLIRIMRRSER